MRRQITTYWVWAEVALLAAGNALAATVSPLYSRGYTVIPEPQRVTLRGSDFRFGDGWQLELGRSVPPDDVAVESLKQGLESRFHLSLSRQGRGGARVVRLAITRDSVTIGEAADGDKASLAEQAYKIALSSGGVSITANAAPGLFYGVQTLLQLIKRQQGALWLPEGEIVDWPDLELRTIYWDDAHHLDHLDVLKSAIRQAAFFKINGFSLKLEGHFQYKSAPAMVEPYALAPAELQELTDYAARYHVQLIPYLDGPAHIAFILKHPEYAKLREFPESNYELCVTNPESYKLLFGMYDDLLEANKGSKYFVLSTDEPYYVGMADNAQCREAARAKELGSVGKLLAEFVTKTAGYLHERGRRVIFWGEYPLKPEDIASLPNYLVNGEIYGPAFDPVFKAHGIRQMVYVSTEGEERLFPNYYALPPSEGLHPNFGASWGVPSSGRVPEMFDYISFPPARTQADLMGVFVAGWADAGLHPETFWLGYATGPAAGWHPASPGPRETMSAFYPLFYGPGATDMGRVYQLMSWQAQFWTDSWETVASSARKPIFGNSNRIFTPRRPESDQTLPLPALPAPGYLTLGYDWTQDNAKRLELASKFRVQNDELLDLLYMNLRRVQFNHYNLEVFTDIAKLCRQNLLLLQNLGRMDGFLKSAQAAATHVDSARAVAELDHALDLAEEIREQRNSALHDATETWYKSWFPRVAEANGRRFLHELDDVKDHVPDRTVDMSYLVYRELLLPLGEWVDKVQAVRNQYAQANNLPARNEKFDWQDTTTLVSHEEVSEEEQESIVSWRLVGDLESASSPRTRRDLQSCREFVLLPEQPSRYLRVGRQGNLRRGRPAPASHPKGQAAPAAGVLNPNPH
jgi:hypothetical protein